MAYLILKDNNPESGNECEKYYEFDENDADKLKMIEELIEMRGRSSVLERKKIKVLLDDRMEKK